MLALEPVFGTILGRSDAAVNLVSTTIALLNVLEEVATTDAASLLCRKRNAREDGIAPVHCVAFD